MENLEQQCLEKLNNILSKFDLAINIVNIPSIECQYRLVDNSIAKNHYSGWLSLWLSVSDILTHCHSIFKCLKSYYDAVNDIKFLTYTPYNINKFCIYQKYSEAYNAIKYLENICCLEEFLIKCDLIGI